MVGNKTKKFVAAKNAFHGKTWQPGLLPDAICTANLLNRCLMVFTHVEYGDAAAVDAAVDEDTAAVILEVCSGRGRHYCSALRVICVR